MIKNLFTVTLALMFSFVIWSQNETYNTDKVIVRFNFKLIDWKSIDDENIQSLEIGDLLNKEGKYYLSKLTQKSFELEKLKATKIFPFLQTKDSISIGRQGQIVYCPPFWATFNIEVPDEESIHNFIKELRQLYPIVIYVHPNFKIETTGLPNDPLFYSQKSLYDSLSSNGNIDIDSAWAIETGERHIKVGIFDTGIDSTHEDLNILTGWGYYAPEGSQWGNDSLGHGTAVAGIIGAKRNNYTGIAGIAGGNGVDKLGVSLIDFKYNNNESIVGDADILSAGIIDACRRVGTYYDWSPYIVNDGVNQYYDKTPGYGIHIGNHSYAIRRATDFQDIRPQSIYDDTILIDGGGEFQNCDLCKESFLFSLQNGVVSVVSRGNVMMSGQNDPYGSYYDPLRYPAGYHDSWVLSVAASGTDGDRLISSVNTGSSGEGWFSPQGRDIDVVAPGTKALVLTTKSTQQIPFNDLYRTFNGTSASAPHVSGVAALLLSKYNKDCYSQQNLDPADVEYIIQQSATDKNDSLYDENTGWGLLNARKALKMIDFPKLQIIHPEDNVISTEIIQYDTINFFHNKSLMNNGSGPLSSSYPLEMNKNYKAERIKFQIKYSFESYISQSTDLLDIWIRHSQTNSLGLINDTNYFWDYYSFQGNLDSIWTMNVDTFKIEPMTSVIDYTDSTVMLEGYYYHFIGKYATTIDIPIISPIDYWYPVNPNIESPKMSFSIYIHDSLATERYSFECDSNNLLFDTLTPFLNITENIEESITIFPNPTFDELTIQITNSDKGYINIFDIRGRLILKETIINGKVIYHFNVANFESGIYYVNWMNMNNTELSRKWIKQ